MNSLKRSLNFIKNQVKNLDHYTQVINRFFLLNEEIVYQDTINYLMHIIKELTHNDKLLLREFIEQKLNYGSLDKVLFTIEFLEFNEANLNIYTRIANKITPIQLRLRVFDISFD